MNDKEIYKIIFSNFTESLKTYDKNSKSDFWNKFFNKSKISKISKINLNNFRKPKIWGSKLSSGMDDDFSFFHTIETYIDLLDSFKKNDMCDYIELNIGNPKFYKIGGININYHEITTYNLLKKVSAYIKNEHKVICEIGGGFASLASKLKKNTIICQL